MPGIKGPGIRVYPFTHRQVGYGFLLEQDERPGMLFLAPLPTTPKATLLCFIGMWLHRSPGQPFPFIYLVRDDDEPTIRAMEGLQWVWAQKYPAEEFPLFESNMTEAEILEAVDHIISEWGRNNPGEPYPRSNTVETEH